MVEYDLPPGTKSSDRISVSAKRKGVNLRVPSRIPAADTALLATESAPAGGRRVSQRAAAIACSASGAMIA